MSFWAHENVVVLIDAGRFGDLSGDDPYDVVTFQVSKYVCRYVDQLRMSLLNRVGGLQHVSASEGHGYINVCYGRGKVSARTVELVKVCHCLARCVGRML